MKFFTFMAASAAVVLLSGCAAEKIDVSGTISIPAISTNLEDYEPDVAGDNCYFGQDGNPYPDVDFGAQVKLRDSTGATVGLGNLSKGGLLMGWSADGIRVYSSSDTFMEDYCVFDFVIEQVELRDEIYSLEVANRGEVSYTKEDLISGASLSLGD